MLSPHDACEDIEAGAPHYCRPLPRRARYASAGGGALAPRLSTFHPSPSGPAFAVPFSWERRPGIPKAPVGPFFASPSAGVSLLPRPPPLRSAPAASSSSYPRKKRVAAAAVAVPDDPFAAALAECAKCSPGPSIEELLSRSGAAAEPRRRVASAFSDSLGLLGLHAASCKAACAVTDAAVYIPRHGSRSGSAYGYSNRRRSR